MTSEERFFSKIDVGDCWQWTACISSGGYGHAWHDGRVWQAHRLAYTFLVGPISEGLQLDHLCRNRACVNPDHLEPVTQTENIRRGAGGRNFASRTHCPQGHPYNAENTIPRGNGRWRRCKACAEAAWAKKDARKKAERFAWLESQLAQ